MLKKKRFVPLYKKFVRLRKNVQNRKKLLTNFNRKKWLNLVSFLNFSLVSRKKNFNVYDQFTNSLPKYSNSFNKKFLNNLLSKQRFSLFYGHLTDKTIKKLIKNSKFSTRTKKIPSPKILLNLLENRLCVILYRSHFATSIRNAKLLIQHGHIKVNNKIVTFSNYLVKNGDLISVNKSASSKKVIKNNLYNSNFWPLPPKYLQINYKTFQLIIIENCNTFNTHVFFPFWLDINNLINYHK